MARKSGDRPRRNVTNSGDGARRALYKNTRIDRSRLRAFRAGSALVMLFGLANAGYADETVADEIEVDPITVRGRDNGGLSALTSTESNAKTRERARNEPAFVTVISVDDRAGETVPLAEVLAESVGVYVRSFGGLGAFTSISVRGASPGATQVTLDGVPLSTIASATADLSRFDLATLSSVEVYRGASPVRLGGGAQGSAVNLVTAIHNLPLLTLSAGAGSFGARHSSLRIAGESDTQAGEITASYRGARGDFEFFSDNGTNLNPDDDSFQKRSNNQFERVELSARGQRQSSRSEYSGGVRLLGKDQGVPGLASVQTQNTSLRTATAIADASLKRSAMWHEMSLVSELSGFFLSEYQRYRDLDNEVGLGAQNRRYMTNAGGVSGSVTAVMGLRHLVSVGANGRFDSFDEHNVGVADGQRSNGSRIAGSVWLSDDIYFAQDQWVLAPALRVDSVFTRPLADSNRVDPGNLANRRDVFASPRVATRARLSESVALKSSTGLYFRAPTVIELYGDRGFVVGNPGLEPETGWAVDAGAVISPVARGFADRMLVEASGFYGLAHDAIAFSANAGQFTGAQNLGDAHRYGVEVAGSVRLLQAVSFAGNYTWVETRRSSSMPSFDGKALPGRPRQQIYGRVDAALKRWQRIFAVWSDASVATGNFVDAANLNSMPARFLVGTGVKAEVVPGVLASIEVKNLLNQRVESLELSPAPSPSLSRIDRAVSDVLGYPLPGRAFYLQAEWRFR